MKNLKANYLPWMAVAGIVASLAIAVPAFAETSASEGATVTQKAAWVGVGGMHGGENEKPGITGTVSAISGSTLTVTSKGMVRAEPMHKASGTIATPPASALAGITYTVNASNATVYKNGATSTIASVATGDTVMVQGTVSGTTVTATVVRDGVGGTLGQPGTPSGKGDGRGSTSTLPTSIIKGNGEPIIGGNITAINGTTLTVTNASNVTYTVDASSATIVKGNATSSIANVATGDSVVVQGTVNGTSITASSVIDQGTKTQNASSTNDASASHGNFVSGIFGAIGGFFSHLFGF
jgi:hypothetical protein